MIVLPPMSRISIIGPYILWLWEAVGKEMQPWKIWIIFTKNGIALKYYDSKLHDSK